MLKKHNRLTKKKDFDRLFQEHQNKYYGDFFGVRLVANGLGYSRFGFMVSKRTCRLAVGRNLLKRRVSSIIRANLSNLKPGFDVVILVVAKKLPMNFLTISQELAEAWKKLRMIV